MNDRNIEALSHRLAATQSRYRLPAGSREIILVRHGATVGDTHRYIDVGGLRLADPELRGDGHRQAEALAARLRGEALSAIFVSPLSRTHETARPLAAVLGLEPVVIPALHEVHMGEWEHDFHARAAEGSPLLQQMMLEESWEVIPGAESMAAVAARLRGAIVTMVERLPVESSAVAVVHGGVIGEICRQATASTPFAIFAPEHASISRLVVQAGGRWSLRSYNDVAHLG
jgi:probable phosphoglycerate mutase